MIDNWVTHSAIALIEGQRGKHIKKDMLPSVSCRPIRKDVHSKYGIVYVNLSLA